MLKVFEAGKSRALSGVSLGLGLLSGVLALLSLSDLYIILRLSSSVSFFLFMARSKVPVGMPPLARLAVEHPVLLFAFGALFWTSACALALGVWRRGEWARSGATAMLYLLAATAALLLLFPGLVVPEPLFYDGQPISPEFNALVGAAAFQLRLFSLLGGALSLWWALLLDRGPLRAEFK